MTDQDLAKIKFRMVAHLNMWNYHACTYESVDYEPKIEMCIHTVVREDGTFGRALAHYRFNGNVYKTKKKFLEAMTTWEEEKIRHHEPQSTTPPPTQG